MLIRIRCNNDNYLEVRSIVRRLQNDNTIEYPIRILYRTHLHIYIPGKDHFPGDNIWAKAFTVDITGGEALFKGVDNVIAEVILQDLL